MDKQDNVVTHNELLLSLKKEWNDVFCSNRDRPRDYHTKKSEKNKYHMISLMCRNLKYDTNELIYEIETDSQTDNRLVAAKGEDGWMVSLTLVDANCVY